jgi:hypothetical protein
MQGARTGPLGLLHAHDDRARDAPELRDALRVRADGLLAAAKGRTGSSGDQPAAS